jgi:hypothetical protein
MIYAENPPCPCLEKPAGIMCPVVAIASAENGPKGTVTGISEPPAACRKMRAVPDDPNVCTYRPPGSRQAPMTPGPPELPRCAVSAVGRRPSAGTSHNRPPVAPRDWHEATITARFHHRDGTQSPARAPGTSSYAPRRRGC